MEGGVEVRVCQIINQPSIAIDPSSIASSIDLRCDPWPPPSSLLSPIRFGSLRLLQTWLPGIGHRELLQATLVSLANGAGRPTGPRWVVRPLSVGRGGGGGT